MISLTKTQAELILAYIDMRIDESLDVQAAFERGKLNAARPSLATYLAIMNSFEPSTEDFSVFAATTSPTKLGVI